MLYFIFYFYFLFPVKSFRKHMYLLISLEKFLRNLSIVFHASEGEIAVYILISVKLRLSHRGMETALTSVSVVKGYDSYPCVAEM